MDQQLIHAMALHRLYYTAQERCPKARMSKLSDWGKIGKARQEFFLVMAAAMMPGQVELVEQQIHEQDAVKEMKALEKVKNLIWDAIDESR